MGKRVNRRSRGYRFSGKTERWKVEDVPYSWQNEGTIGRRGHGRVCKGQQLLPPRRSRATKGPEQSRNPAIRAHIISRSFVSLPSLDPRTRLGKPFFPIPQFRRSTPRRLAPLKYQRYPLDKFSLRTRLVLLVKIREEVEFCGILRGKSSSRDTGFSFNFQEK